MRYPYLLILVLLSCNSKQTSKKLNFQGNINSKVNCEINLTIKGNTLEGILLNSENKQRINLRGKIVENFIRIEEFAKENQLTGIFEGNYSGEKYTGNWISPDREIRVPFTFENKIRNERVIIDKKKYDYKNEILSKTPASDKFDFLKKAKVFFEEYIVVRLKEVDEEGYAYEYVEAREFYTGDINLDGVPDVVVLYTIEAVGRGNNWYRHILLLPNINNEISEINSSMVYGTLSGQGKFIGIQKGYAVFDMLTYSSDNIIERMKEGKPSKYQRIGYGIREKQIVVEKIE